jgi:methyl coenzyme M reductase subunit D
MNEYSPFLKFKQGEMTALINLAPADRKIIIPLLELPRDNKNTKDKVVTKIDKSAKRMKKNIELNFSFYIDNYEVSDDIMINGGDNYLYLINSFKDFDIIPVIGFDRTKTHNSIGIKYANTKSKKIAVRMTYEHFHSFLAYKKDLKMMINELEPDIFCTILLDCYYMDDLNNKKYDESILKMLENIIDIQRINKIVISGSSIPNPIGKKVGANTNVSINRDEVDLFKKIKKIHQKIPLIFGDYTVTSPEYSELNIDLKHILNVMTPRIIYSLLDSHYVSRGRAIKPHGFIQYYKQTEDILKEQFFRGDNFSWGDKYLVEKVNGKKTFITQSSIVGPVVNAHIKFMISEILKGSI